MAPSKHAPILSKVAGEVDEAEVYFEAKYYGPCPSIPVGTNQPPLDDLLTLMATRKTAGTVVRCHLNFSDRGVAVIDRKTGVILKRWDPASMATCATAAHPSSKVRRLGLLKIRDAETGVDMWHLFKYYFSKKDNMEACFKYVVDCALRNLGRKCAERIISRHSMAPSATLIPFEHDEVADDDDDAGGEGGYMDVPETHTDNSGYMEVTSS
mmetsp:Transcript_37384/g.98010  ORF Transcript_37384/g.98010 Transcript_37384/m.98010 type:complete len:211 (+) Transcript_37384:234-866(+)|eukprot:CAMPEP_0182927904 /NCGR_PEP_ID=MMETSP0105_2-20130417/14633_1 /TAXON_ID=81532 ORGANISM="Acanthoeca-like sp., Strain 10tr" /NCGR_SAMPLE_ID=MMETSP0105_2 /ASSEMBLY_ACC=CAM_ASM_000205 /LENGTH=210 /DNA_ID=CAMNT_0025065883 /DNA_START=223 /DNA_END=855 /DNA_ORIENTATION=+